MKLHRNENIGVFVWVDSSNESIELSPHFDYEEDADQWYLTLKEKMNNESRGRQTEAQCSTA